MKNKHSWNFKDITGQRFGMLTVIQLVEQINPKEHRKWMCKCDCGNTHVASGAFMRTGKTTHCGCMTGVLISQKKTRHGLYKSRLYNIWRTMRQRCTENTGNQKRDTYYMKGIRVCEEWQTFDNFMEWALENGYSDKLTIDRINNDGGYYPDNCRWVTNDVQSLNKRNTVMVDFEGERIPLLSLCRQLNVPWQRVYQRIYKSGWSVERAITEPPRTATSADYKSHEVLLIVGNHEFW